MSRIKIARDSGYVDRVRKYKIFCNSINIGEIGNGETIEVDVPPGENTIHLGIDWCTSNKMTCNISAGETVSFSCGSSLKGLKIFLSLIYITFLRHKYLWLSHTNG